MSNKKIDITKYLVPIHCYNENTILHSGQSFSTTDDFVRIDSVEELNSYNTSKKKSATDFALDNNANQCDIYPSPSTGMPTSAFWTSDSSFGMLDVSGYANCINVDGAIYSENVQKNNICVSPSVHLNLESIISDGIDFSDCFKIKKLKTDYGKIYILEMGEYPRSNVDDAMQEKLEYLYNNGNLRSGIKASGRFYTTNGQRNYGEDFLSKQNPEFEIDGEKYVRVITWTNDRDNVYQDGTRVCESGEIKWKKVEPIKFEICNWKTVLKDIQSHNKRKNRPLILDLKAEEGIISGIPFYPKDSDENRNEWQNSLLRCFLNSTKTEKLHVGSDRKSACTWDFEKSGFLYQAFDLAREPIKEYVVPKTEKEICDDAFSGCVTLEKIVIHKGIKKIGNHAFDGCVFNFAYHEKNSKNLVLAKSLPEDLNSIENVVDLDKFNKVFDNFDYSVLLNKTKPERIIELADKLKNSSLKFPYKYVDDLQKNNYLEEFISKSDFRFLKSEIPNIKDILKDQTIEEKQNFYKFAAAFGCFSKERIKDKNGKETEVIMAQKASSLLALLLKNKALQIGEFENLFASLKPITNPNQEFLKFAGVRGENGLFNNVELLVKLSSSYPDIFVKVMSNFKKAKSFKNTLNEQGKPVSISWESAFRKFYSMNTYKGVTEKNQDLAALFGSVGLSQRSFEKADKIREDAKKKNMPAHVLGESLKEETILESLERLKDQTSKLIGDSKKVVDQLFEKKFTYEMLDKYDPHNLIIGLFCSCCCTITNQAYGKSIAKASATAEDVQNLVVHNVKGEIIAKGTMYVNKKIGYAVINDFEINQKYRKHEIKSSGFYAVDNTSSEEKERDMIFNALVRGVKAFVNKYNEKNPTNPIKKVNVGMGYNRLKLQCKRLRKETQNLKVPAEYSFLDAEDEQRVIYDREKEIRCKEKEDRFI